MTITTEFNDIDGALRKPVAAKGDYSHYRIVPARYPARTVGTMFAVLVIAATVHSVLGNPRWGWDVFAECSLPNRS